MLIDPTRFIAQESPHWEELRSGLDALDNRLAGSKDPDHLLRVHGLYRRAASGLHQLESSAADPVVTRDLETLVARAYAEIHAHHGRRPWQAFIPWLVGGFPSAFRRHFGLFLAVLWITLAGAVVGAVVLTIDRDHRQHLVPFSHLHGTPSERVAAEERAVSEGDRANATFAAYLIQNNVSVTFRAIAFGLTYAIGTVILLFYNGVILGAVVFDYITDGQTIFLLGWLLPHGVTELPAIFIGGQAGLLLGRALLGRGDRAPLRERLRKTAPDVASLAMGAVVLLLWAALVESYLSQNHEPMVPYSFKIMFGLMQLAGLAFWLARGGRAATGNGGAR